jgi:hypothetical protein
MNGRSARAAPSKRERRLFYEDAAAERDAWTRLHRWLDEG